LYRCCLDLIISLPTKLLIDMAVPAMRMLSSRWQKKWPIGRPQRTRKSLKKKASDSNNSPISKHSHSQSPSASRQVTGVDPNKQSISDLVDLDMAGRNSVSVDIGVDPFSELDKELHSIGLSPHSIGLSPRGPEVVAPDTPTTSGTENQTVGAPVVPVSAETPSSMSAVDALQHNVLNRYYKKDLLQDKYRKSTTDLEWDEMNPARAAAAAAVEGHGHHQKHDSARVQLRTGTTDADMSEPKNDLKTKSGCCIIM